MRERHRLRRMRQEGRRAVLLCVFVLVWASFGPLVRESAGRKPARQTAHRQASEAPQGVASPAPAGDTPQAGSAQSAFPFPSDPYRQLAAESALDSLRVLPWDGRPVQGIPIHRTPEGPYVPLGSLGRALSGGFKWDPESWRGSLRVDSTDIQFVLDTSVFWVHGVAIQTPTPVRLLEDAVNLPLAVLDGVIVPLLGDRCRWDPTTGELLLGGPKPWLETLQLAGSGPSATLTIAPVGENSLQVRWDPVGFLWCEGKGAWWPAGFRGVDGTAEGVEVSSAGPTLRGFEFCLRLAPSWQGVRLRAGRAPRSVVIELTARPSEVAHGRYEALGTYLEARTADPRPIGPGRHILLEIQPEEEAGVEGALALRTLADELAAILEQDFGHGVTIVADRGVGANFRSPAGLPETPGPPSGDCWVGLRLDDWPGSRTKEFLLVTPHPAPRQELLNLSVTSAEGLRSHDPEEYASVAPRVVPWGQVARLADRASLQLARTIADHLNYQWNGRPVRIASRPSRIFRGLAMPAVLLYPAIASDADAIAALSDSTQAGPLARDLAFALDEFLLGQGREP